MKEFFIKRAVWITVTLLVVGGSFFVGYKEGEKSRNQSVEQVTTLINKETGQPEKVDFAPFWTAWNVINEKFVTAKATTTDQEKVYGAIQGLAKSLGDPYTVFFPPEEDKRFETEISGAFEGVGMEIGIKGNVLTVVSPLKDTPAYRAGIKSGDQILKIDDKSTSEMTVESAVSIIRGTKGSSVRLTISRQDKPAPFEVTLTREVIKIPTINTELKPGSAAEGGSEIGLREDGIFVITLYSFTGDAANLFRGALRQFVESGAHKLILDLRGNPGGYLEASVDIASWFLPAGKVVVSEEYATGRISDVYRSRGYNVFNGRKLEMVILVNQGSASASEILAGALQEHGVAKLVGMKTFGKGSVQELVKITPDTSLKVTVARWLTPNGRSISEQGLEPDVVVDFTQADAEKKADPQMKAAVDLLNKLP